MNQSIPEQDARAHVLVCVTDQLSCERLINAGVVLAKSQELPVRVLSVLPEGLVNEHTAAVMQSLYDTASALGAEMTFYFNGSPALTAAVYATKHKAVHIISGSPGSNSNQFIETVKGLLPEIPVTIVDTDGQMFTFPKMPISRAINA